MSPSAPSSPCQVGFPRCLAGGAPRAHEARASRSGFGEKLTSGLREETTASPHLASPPKACVTPRDKARPAPEAGDRERNGRTGGPAGPGQEAGQGTRVHRRHPPRAWAWAHRWLGRGPQRPAPGCRFSGRETATRGCVHVAGHGSSRPSRPAPARHGGRGAPKVLPSGPVVGGWGGTGVPRVEGSDQAGLCLGPTRNTRPSYLVRSRQRSQEAGRIKNDRAHAHRIKPGVDGGRSRQRSPCTPKRQSRGAGLACGSASEGSPPCPAAGGRGRLGLLGPQKGVRAQDPHASIPRGEAQRGRRSDTCSL